MTTDDPTTRFAVHADAYARGRPGYAPALVPLLQQLGIIAHTVVADLGAGTGASCAVLLATGARVIAVEPEPGMRRHALDRFADEPRFTAVDGRAEATGLPQASVDHVTAMQAMHWFAIEPTRAELRRILRPGGRVVLAWNTRQATTAAGRELEVLYRRFAPDYERHGHVGAVRDAHIAALFPHGHDAHALPHQQRLDRDGIFALIGSVSYLPRPGTAEHPALMAATAALAEAHGDDIVIDYTTDVYVGAV
jgi:SAM-dependent methyltransferase